MIETIVNFEKMDELIVEITRIKGELIKNFSYLNTNLKKIDENWDGKKSKDVLSPVDGIISQNTMLLENIESNINILKEASKNYKEKTSGEVVAPIPTVPIDVKSEEKPISTSTTDSEKGPVNVIKDVEYRPSYSPASSEEMIKVDNALLSNIGVKFDLNGNPMKVGNAYVIQQPYGKSYKNNLLFLPINSNGEIPKNSPVFIELHGNNEASNYINVTSMPNVMGLKETNNNPDFPGIIIIPQVDNAKYEPGDIAPIHEYYTQIKNTFETKDKAFLYGFSAGLHGSVKYLNAYGETDIKAAVVFDAAPSDTNLKNIPKHIPLVIVASNNKIEEVAQTFNYLKYSKIPTKIYGGIDGSKLPWTKIDVNNFNVNDYSDPRNTYISVLRDALSDNRNIEEGNIRAVNISGTSHAETRDFGTGSYFYDVIFDTTFN